MCCLLGSMAACLLVPCTSRERYNDMVHYNCLDSLTAGLKQTTAFCMIAYLYHDLYQVVWVWFCGRASELDRVLCTLPIPHGWALVPVPVTGRSASPYRRPLNTEQKTVLEYFVMVGDGKGSQFMHLLRNALHLTLQARCPGCRFELKQVGFTATYRPRQCLLTSRNTLFSIFRAGLLQPNGSESWTGHNRLLIRTLGMC
jgi:hypothetical protein